MKPTKEGADDFGVSRSQISKLNALFVLMIKWFYHNHEKQTGELTKNDRATDKVIHNNLNDDTVWDIRIFIDLLKYSKNLTCFIFSL